MTTDLSSRREPTSGNRIQQRHFRIPWLLGGTLILVGVALLIARRPPPETSVPPGGTTASPLPAIAAAAAPLTVEDMAGFLDDALGRQMEREHIKAAAVAVVRDGDVLVAKGYGTSDLEGQQPVDAEQTIFLTGSTGKVFVWTAVMQLVEQGKLDLDTDVNEYLGFRIPDTFPQPITLRHLMSHTAGFEDRYYLYAHEPGELEPLGEYLAPNMPERVRPPGQISAYSNYGTALAGHLVEIASGQIFEQYAEEHIFKPLGMTSTSFLQPPPSDLAARRVPSYSFQGGVFTELPPKYVRMSATGGSVTTAADMARFMIAHLDNGHYGTARILSEQTALQMHSRHFSHDPRVNGFAYGFAESSLNGVRLLRHEGEVPGRGCSALLLLPTERLGFYVTYNGMCTMNSGTEIWHQLLDRYLPAPNAAPTPASVTSASDLAVLAGSYRSSRLALTSFGKSIVLSGGPNADIRVTIVGDGALRTVGLGPSALSWVEVEPFVFQPASDNHSLYGRLVFQPASGEHGARLLVENTPYRAWEKIAWYETVEAGFVLVAGCAIVLLSALAVPLAAPVLRRRIAVASHPGAELRRARRLAAAAAGLYLLFPFAFVMVGFDAMEYGPTAPLLVALALPMLACLLVIASLYFAARAWKDPAWGGMAGRLHYVAVVVAAMLFTVWLGSWNLLGFRF